MSLPYHTISWLFSLMFPAFADIQPTSASSYPSDSSFVTGSSFTYTHTSDIALQYATVSVEPSFTPSPDIYTTSTQTVQDVLSNTSQPTSSSDNTTSGNNMYSTTNVQTTVEGFGSNMLYTASSSTYTSSNFGPYSTTNSHTTTGSAVYNTPSMTSVAHLTDANRVTTSIDTTATVLFDSTRSSTLTGKQFILMCIFPWHLLRKEAKSMWGELLRNVV